MSPDFVGLIFIAVIFQFAHAQALLPAAKDFERDTKAKLSLITEMVQAAKKEG